MDSFKQFIAESNPHPNIHPNLIEYLTRKVFTMKNLKRAVNSVHKQFNGSKNMFLGGDVSFTPEELTDAYYLDKAKTIKTTQAKMPDEKKATRFAVDCAYFCVDPETVKRYMDKV